MLPPTPARSSSSTRSTSRQRAGAAGVRRVLVRVTPGVEAETHEAIRTGHRGSKFGLDADEAVEAVRAALGAGLDVEGLHVHVGSQLADVRSHLLAVALLARVRRALPRRAGLDAARRRHRRWLRHPPRRGRSRSRPSRSSCATLAAAVEREWAARGLPAPRLIVEPGRSLVGPAAFTLYRVGAVKNAGERRYVAIDGGMSDNPRPQLYGRVTRRCSRTARTRSRTASSRSQGSTASRATC